MASLRPSFRLLLSSTTRRSLIPVLPTTSHSCSLWTHSRSHPQPLVLAPTTIPTNQMPRCNHMTSGANEQHPGPSAKAKANGRRLQLLTGAWTALLGACYILYRQLNAKEDEEEGKGAESQGEEKCEEKDKKRVSFHDRRVIEYENRIRAYSTPDKIFRYFATINIKDPETGAYNVYMTPEDFLRSITPNELQPSEYGLDKFMNITLENWKKLYAKQNVVRSDSVFASLGYYGLISFSDYLFLLTIIATPTKRFEIAFKMFDLNGDGEVDCSEFETVQAVILNSTAVGARHRDHGTTGSVAGSVGDALIDHFFGPNKDQRLTVDKFKVFHTRLMEEIMKLEFDRYDQVNGCISEYDFSRLVLSYASMNDQRKKKYYKRIKKVYGTDLSDCPQAKNQGITFEEMKLFSRLADEIRDVETALSMYLAAGASITADDLMSVAKAVTGIELTKNLVNFIITLFDEDGDGELSYKEFIKVIKSRTSRGLEKSKELGFSRLLGAMSACSVKTVKDQLGITS